MDEYLTDPAITAMVVQQLNAQLQHKGLLENTSRLQRGADGVLRFTPNKLQGQWDPLLQRVISSLGNRDPSDVAIVHDHGGAADSGTPVGDRNAAARHGLPVYLQEPDFDIYVIEPTERKRNGDFKTRSRRGWRATD